MKEASGCPDGIVSTPRVTVDNYKALSSKSTGSRSAAPLWQSYMSKIHQGLSNRDILEGSASDYGLPKTA